MKLQHNICLLNDSFPPLIDGVANVVSNYADCFTHAGRPTMVVTPAHPQANDQNCRYPVIRYPSIDLRKKTGYMAGVPFSPEAARVVKEKKVSILHTHCPIMSALLGRELRQISGAPLILTYHTKYDIDITNSIHNTTLQNSGKKALLDNINACDEVWTVSRGAGDNLRAMGYEGEYTVMPNGVDFPRGRVTEERMAAVTEKWPLPRSVPTYLFVGRMMWYKGVRIILDALTALQRCGQPFRMVFIGDGTDRIEIEQYASKCGIADNCCFVGSVDEREQLRAWYCRADLFLFPSSFDTNGLVVREAAACSLPSVLIRDSAAAEDVVDQDTGFLIEENADSLFQFLRKYGQANDVLSYVGERAATELYLSWKDASEKAFEQYLIIEEKNNRGEYMKYRNKSERIYRMNGELMEGIGYIRRSFRSTPPKNVKN